MANTRRTHRSKPLRELKIRRELRARVPDDVPRALERGELLGERRAEEGVQLEGGLFDEAFGEGGDRTWLEVDGVEEFREERCVGLGKCCSGECRLNIFWVRVEYS